MAIISGETNKVKLYTGLAKVNIVAINPDKETLNKWGLSHKEEPNYLTTSDEGKKQVRIDFWTKNETKKLYQPIRVYLTQKGHIASTGNTEFINDLGQSSYAIDLATLKQRKIDKNLTWLEVDTMRVAWEGEVNLIDLLKNWLCVGKESVAKIDNWDALFNGNMEELDGLIDLQEPESKKPYKIQILYYINTKGFQAIYNRFYGRMDSMNTGRWKVHFEGSTSQLNYGNDFNFKEFSNTDTPSDYADVPKQENKSDNWG